MADRDRFYQERDQRSRQYLDTAHPYDKPVRIRVGPDAAATPAGQTLALTLLNMACRIHRRVELVVADAPLLIPSLVQASGLRDSATVLAHAIDPYIQLGPLSDADVPTVAIGNVAGNIHLGADGYIGTCSDEPVAVTDHSASMIGAGLGACLGAAALVHVTCGSTFQPRRVSLWGFGEAGLDRGPDTPLEPVDVGKLGAIIGAGAVGSAIAYWFRLLGLKGHWWVVDGDMVELHNTNRSIGMLAIDAGWGDGEPGGCPATKATVAAMLIGAEPVEDWYDTWIKAAPRLDVLIPAGGEREIRRQLGYLGMPFLIQGATSTAWQAQLHRHGRPGDSCPACRFRATPQVAPECSTGSLPVVPTGEGSNDAAVPCLSATAGLMVVAALTQIEHGYLDQSINQHGLLFDDGISIDWCNTITRCKPSCSYTLSAKNRRNLNAGKRWARLD
jgi:hypothetical protein